MKIRTIKNSFALTAVAMVLSACGSSSGEDDGSEPAIGAAIGLEQTASAANTNYIAITDEELGDLAEVPDTDTSRLQVFDDFTFETARETNVYMSVPEAVGVSAEASFCTDYSLKDNGDYDVNYESCVLTTPMFGGIVDEELSLVNHHESVLGVVWFQDANMAPQYQEFQFD